LLSVRVPKGFAWSGNPRIRAASDAAKARLQGRGRVLLRPSGTEPVLRVMVEGEDGALVARLADDIAQEVGAAASEEGNASTAPKAA